jgi:hypothetical protein
MLPSELAVMILTDLAHIAPYAVMKCQRVCREWNLIVTTHVYPRTILPKLKYKYSELEEWAKINEYWMYLCRWKADVEQARERLNMGYRFQPRHEWLPIYLPQRSSPTKGCWHPFRGVLLREWFATYEKVHQDYHKLLFLEK